MKIFLTLLLLVTFTACGPDDSGTDEYGDALPNNSNLSEKDEGVDNDVTVVAVGERAPLCEPGLLCPGMTKQEVLEAVGRPTDILDYGFADHLEWQYHPDDNDICTTEYTSCKIVFSRKTGLLKTTQYVDTDFLDVTAF